MTTAGVTAFRRIQIRNQTARGTRRPFRNVDKPLYGTLQLTPDRQFYLPEEDRNSLAQLHRATTTATQSNMRFEGSLQFETFKHIARMAFSQTQGTAPVVSTIHDASASTSPEHLRDYVVTRNMRERNAPNSHALQFGDNYAGYQVDDCLISNLELRWAMNDVIMLSADIFGGFPRILSTTSRVPNYGTPTYLRVTDAVSQLTDVYIGNDKDVYKTNPTLSANGVLLPAAPDTDNLKSGLMSALTMSIPTGLEPVRYSSGSVNLEDFSEMKSAFDLDFTIRHNEDGAAEYAAYTNEAFRFFELRVNGPVAEELEYEFTPETGPKEDRSETYNHTIVFRFGCQYIESPQFFTDGGGDNLFSIRARTVHDPSWDRDLEIFIRTNNQA